MANRNNIVEFPLLSPLKFNAIGDIDNITNFAIPDFARANVDIFPNVHSLPYKFLHLNNTNLVFQIRKAGTLTLNLYDNSDGSLTSLSVESNATPTNWTGKSVYNYTVPFIVDGCYKLILTCIDGGIIENYESEWIEVVSELEEIIKIEFTAFTNEFGVVFSKDGAAETFRGITYAYGRMFDVQPTSETEVGETDRGNPVTLSSTLKNIYNIEIDLIPEYKRKLFSFLWACEYVYVNNIQLKLIDGFEYEKNANGNTGSASITTQQVDFDFLQDEWNYNENYNLITDNEDDFIGNNTDTLLTI